MQLCGCQHCIRILDLQILLCDLSIPGEPVGRRLMATTFFVVVLLQVLAVEDIAPLVPLFRPRSSTSHVWMVDTHVDGDRRQDLLRLPEMTDGPRVTVSFPLVITCN